MPKGKYSQEKIDEVVDLYINQELPLRKSAERAHIKPETARKLIIGAGYKIRPKNATREKNISKQELEQLYIKEGKSVKEVAETLGVSNGTAGNYLKKYGLTRGIGEALALSQQTNIWNDAAKESLRRYIEEGMTYAEIAKLFNTSEEAVAQVGRNLLNISKSIWTDAAFENQVKDYLEQTLNYSETATKFGISEKTLIYKNRRSWGFNLSCNSTMFGQPQLYDGPNTRYKGATIRSKSELQIIELLDSNNIDWQYEEPYIPGTKKKPDFYLPKYDIWVEYDGLGQDRKNTPDGVNYGFKHPKIQAYRKAGCNLCLINKNNQIKGINSLIYALQHQGSIKNLYNIKQSTKQECDSLLRPLHYLGKAPKGTSIFVGLYIEEYLVGCATFGRGTNKHLSSSVGGNAYELTRFFTVDWLPKNSGSYFMSHIIKLIKNQYPDIEYLVSFADPEVKHTGGIYKAANWKYLGQNKKDYCYMINGERIHKSKFRCKDGKTEKELAKEAGAIKVPIQGKHKYIYALCTNKK